MWWPGSHCLTLSSVGQCDPAPHIILLHYLYDRKHLWQKLQQSEIMQSHNSKVNSTTAESIDKMPTCRCYHYHPFGLAKEVKPARQRYVGRIPQVKIYNLLQYQGIHWDNLATCKRYWPSWGSLSMAAYVCMCASCQATELRSYRVYTWWMCTPSTNIQNGHAVNVDERD